MDRALLFLLILSIVSTSGCAAVDSTPLPSSGSSESGEAKPRVKTYEFEVTAGTAVGLVDSDVGSFSFDTFGVENASDATSVELVASWAARTPGATTLEMTVTEEGFNSEGVADAEGQSPLTLSLPSPFRSTYAVGMAPVFGGATSEEIVTITVTIGYAS